MFIGHFGLGFGSKKLDRAVSLGTYFFAVQFLDLIWPIFLLLGWEKAEPIPTGPPLENLDFVSYPYSHSLFFALIWGLLFGIIHYIVKKKKTTAILLGFLVVSHWILDFFTHIPDLPLTPWSSYKVGLGLWNYPAATVVIESIIFIGGIIIYLKNVSLKSKGAYVSLFIMILLLALIYISSFLSPPPTSTKLLAKFGLIQWLFILWAYLTDLPGKKCRPKKVYQLKKEKEILEFPSNLGLYEPAPGKEPGVKRLPAWLKEHGLHEIIKPSAVHFLEPPPYSMNLDKISAVRNADNIAAYAKKQVALISKTISQNKFPLVIGGDCSILIGNMLALKRLGNFGLFFLDGHTDYIWPELSGTGGAAGMDLAIVAGVGHDKLTNIDQQKPYVKEEHIWCVGNRELDDLKYISAVENSKVNYFDLNRLRQYGIEKCTTDFLTMIDHENLKGFWIHLDVDVLDDTVMPAVDSRSPGGLSYDELNIILTMLLRSTKATGLEITILDPDLDPDGKYTKVFVEEMGKIF